jgi:hypothetical protein
MAQEIITNDKPIIKIKPLEVSIGILVKGRKKRGKETMIANKDQKEILSKIFDNIFLYLKIINKKRLYYY